MLLDDHLSLSLSLSLSLYIYIYIYIKNVINLDFIKAKMNFFTRAHILKIVKFTFIDFTLKLEKASMVSQKCPINLCNTVCQYKGHLCVCLELVVINISIDSIP